VKPIRVLLVDDQAVFREGLRTLFSLRPDFEIVGEAADGEEAVNCAARVAPDAVLMDLRLPGIDGVECVKRLVSQLKKTQIIMLTVHEDTDIIFNSLDQNGVTYYTLDVNTGIRVDVTAVPEPETYALMLAGLAALGWETRKRRGSVTHVRKAIN